MLNELENISFDIYRLSIENEKKQNTGKESEESETSKKESSSSSSEKSSSSENTSDENQNQKKYSMEKSSVLLNNPKKEINWDYQKVTIETLYPYWNTMMVDFNEIGIDKNDIMNFTKLLDDAITKIQEENKVDTLVILSNMYDYIPKFLEQITQDKKYVYILQVKAYILQVYAIAEQNKWQDMSNIIQKAIDTFLLVMNQSDEIDNNINTLNKVYIYLNDILTAIQKENKDLFLIKYKNLVETITIYQENF